ncbi:MULTISPECIES: aminoglycoside phosphotransferase family protein [Nocardia]|uniref:aminoglycoside phosphotransferase family protein n=1 Tax=Nocardia TaxID=1817 RepID=UPI00245407CE|nr:MULTISPECIES: aminoglycoside phosphotransferase family protein [Nocardia]
MDPSVLTDACQQTGLRHDDARLLRAHSASVYLLPSERAIARISRKEHRGLRAAASVMVAQWLVSQGFPATEPLLDHPVEFGDTTVTFWVYYPQPDRGDPPARELGALLRMLHTLPRPPLELPAYQPLAGLQHALHNPGTLSASDLAWLTDRAAAVIEQYHQLESHLGVGFVHGDAYTGNTLWGPHGVLLGDWDEASIAPRELDLINVYQDVRYGTPESELDEFTYAYGWDVRDWDGFTVLRDMRDLHTLTGFIRRSSHDPAIAAELQLRIEVLRNPDDTRLWHAAT